MQYYKYFNSVSVEAFLEQASEFEGLDEDSYNKVLKFMSTIGKTHPWTVMRAAELNKWKLSGEYVESLTLAKSTT